MLKSTSSSHVIYKAVNGTPIRVVDGAGVWLTDEDGNRYLDTCGGVAVSSLGHRHPRIVAAMRREADRLAWAHAGSFTTDAAEELADLLTAAAPGLDKVQFLSGGSEAVELALKIAYQYHWERGEPRRTTVIARRQNYHGSTLATLAVSGNVQRRSIFEPMLRPTEFVSPCYAYRDQRPGESPEQYAERLAAELEERIVRLGPDTVAAFIAETVVGSTAGAVAPVAGYFRRIAQVCRTYGVLLILDEVMAGMGRTGLPYAYLADDVAPDIVVVGKGLAAGYQPISAIAVTADVHAALAAGSGVLRNGQTHVNHPFACAIALEVQRTIIDDDLLTNVFTRGRQLRRQLTEAFADVDWVGDVRGRGLFVGVEFVADRRTKAPLPEGDRFAAVLKQQALRRGLLIYPAAGTIDGVVGNHVLFAPPFIATESDIAEMVDRFVAVAHDCVEELSKT
ncbi:aspartate aminotransferase family protein [Solwaraspora sp. WMMD406]|uniref:aspartate aminotransferase family protein n=1 Tax=Solwaraspora sp. WMMD406 TaxID=3016095 RepID=UPI002416A1B3|nr:aspartate aminotransferase family protein [Solwaraspora sp. WMMD406]MDG4763215.1 aspartate aminotransferase family protein [Solwaraspora sp. WMMD406]